MANIHYHLLEIKLRFFYLTLSTLCTFFLFYSYQIEIVYIIGKPFIELHQTFIFLELTEAFYTLLKISTIFTLIILIPFFFYHFWGFFIPSFYQSERKKINFFLFFFLFFFVCEILLIYFYLLPKICHFLLSFEMTSNMQNSSHYLMPLISVEFTARIESYVQLIIKISSILLLFFQIPLCIWILYSKKLIHVSSFYNNRKILSLMALLISAFLVPPDALSQLIVAMFFFLVFEFFIFVGFFFE